MPRLSSPAAHPSDLSRILRLEVPVIVKLAERKFSMSEVLRVQIGSILEFNMPADGPLQLLINNKPIAIGDVVKVGENFGLRVKQIGDAKQIIESMGGR